MATNIALGKDIPVNLAWSFLCGVDAVGPIDVDADEGCGIGQASCFHVSGKSLRDIQAYRKNDVVEVGEVGYSQGRVSTAVGQAFAREGGERDPECSVGCWRISCERAFT